MTIKCDTDDSNAASDASESPFFSVKIENGTEIESLAGSFLDFLLLNFLSSISNLGRCLYAYDKKTFKAGDCGTGPSSLWNFIPA